MVGVEEVEIVTEAEIMTEAEVMNNDDNNKFVHHDNAGYTT
jgi:hypothetical protein